MSTDDTERTRLIIMQELLDVTGRMVSQRGEAEVLIDGVETRQMLMDEYDSLADEQTSDEDRVEIKRIAAEIMGKDKLISDALVKLRDETKEDLSRNQKQQQVLGKYGTQSMSSSGSYMDYRK